MSKYVTFDDLVRFHKEVIAPDLDARMDAKLASLEERLDAKFDAKLDAKLDARLAPLATKRDVDDIRTLLAAVTVSLQGTMEAGFHAVSEEAARNKREVIDHFDGVYTRLETMAQEYTALNGGLRRVEKRLSKLDSSAN